MLGVYITLAVQQKTQFEKLRGKVVDAMGKVMNTLLLHQQSAAHYNLYVLTNMHFGCEIVKLQKQEELELRRLCESTILRKLGFSINFLRKVMRVSKEIL